jgi:hypothetical protein
VLEHEGSGAAVEVSAHLHFERAARESGHDRLLSGGSRRRRGIRMRQVAW